MRVWEGEMDGPVMEERNALSGRRAIEAGRRATVRVAEDCARFSLRVGSAAREAAGRRLGVPLPGRIGQVAATGGRTALCLGPDEWSVIAPASEAEAVRRDVEGLDAPHSLVETSHRDVGIEVGGPAAEEMLSAACALDLAAMPAGSCTRTIFDKAAVVLVKHGPDHYRIEVWQSFAPHVWGLLEAVSREVALDI